MRGDLKVDIRRSTTSSSRSVGVGPRGGENIIYATSDLKRCDGIANAQSFGHAGSCKYRHHLHGVRHLHDSVGGLSSPPGTLVRHENIRLLFVF